MSIRHNLSRILIALPIISLFLMAISWLVYGIDLPFLDDWRGYLTGDLNNLSMSNLFKPENDTLYPVGKFLDVLSYWYLDGNSVAYQFISMIVIISSILILTWLIVKKCTEDMMMRAISFSLMIFMLQPGSYWGLQNIAYHQAIPIICILSIIYMAISNFRTYTSVILSIILTLIAGLSYTSGAFSIFSLSLAMIAIYLLSPNANKNLAVVGISSLFTSIITSALQAWVIVFHQRGHIHDQNAAWATPIDLNFWAYSFGKFGRLVMAHVLPAPVGLIAAATLFVMIVVICLVIAYQAIIKQRKMDDTSVVFLSLCAAVGTYLVMVSSSRAGMAPKEFSILQIYGYGTARFHFFWLGILLPFGFLMIIGMFRWKAAKSMFGLAAVCLIGFAVFAGALGHSNFFRETQEARLANEVSCLRSTLTDPERSEILCANVYPIDITPAVNFSLQHNSSWIKYYDISSPL